MKYRVKIFILCVSTCFCLNAEGQTLDDLNQLFQAKEYNQLKEQCLTLTASESFKNFSDTEQAEVYTLLAMSHKVKKRTAAVDYLLQADSLHSKNDLLSLRIRYQLARNYVADNELEKGLQLLDATTERIKQDDFEDKSYHITENKNKPLSWGCYYLKSVILRRMGEFEQAIELLEGIIPQLEDKPEVLGAFLISYSNLLSHQNRDAEALEIRRKLLILFTETGDDYNLNATKLNIATTLANNNEQEESLRMVNEYLAAYKSGQIESPSNAYYVKMIILTNLKKYEKATEVFEEGIAVYREIGDKRRIGYLYLRYLDIIEKGKDRNEFYAFVDSTEYYLSLSSDKQALGSLKRRVISFKVLDSTVNAKDVNELDSVLIHSGANKNTELSTVLLRTKRDALIKLGRTEELTSVTHMLDSLDRLSIQQQQLSHTSYIDNVNKELKIKELKIKEQEQRQRTIILIACLVTLFLVVTGMLIYRNLNQRRKAAIREKELKNQLILYYKSIAHDIKFPLNAIKTSLAEGAKDKNSAQITLVNDVYEIVEKLMQLFEVDEVRVEKRSFALGELIESAGAQLGLSDKIKFSSNKASNLFADRFLMKQVLLNILHNAQQNIDSETGQIKIDYQSDKKYDRISIRDNGVGISENVKKTEDLFQLNFSTSSTLRTKKGVGLFIVKRIVEKHKGFVEIIKLPAEEKGFEIQINLPNAG